MTTRLLKQTLSFVYHFISGSVLIFLFVFLFFGLLGILFIPDFRLSHVLPYYIFFQITYLGVCVIATHFGFILLLLERARKPTVNEELVLGCILLPILSERKIDSLIGISIIDDDVHHRVFILDRCVCFTTATVRKMSKSQLDLEIIHEVEYFLDHGSRFLTLIYFARIPYNLILTFLNFVIGASKRNVFSHWAVGFLFELSYASLHWLQRVANPIQENKTLDGIRVQNPKIYLQEWFKNYSYSMKKTGEPKKTNPHAPQKLKTI